MDQITAGLAAETPRWFTDRVAKVEPLHEFPDPRGADVDADAARRRRLRHAARVRESGESHARARVQPRARAPHSGGARRVAVGPVAGAPHREPRALARRSDARCVRRVGGRRAPAVRDARRGAARRLRSRSISGSSPRPAWPRSSRAWRSERRRCCSSRAQRSEACSIRASGAAPPASPRSGFGPASSSRKWRWPSCSSSDRDCSWRASRA